MKNKSLAMFTFGIISFLLFSIFINSQTQPKAWYVDKMATGLNNGTSWTNAWNSFSSINWTVIQSGDTIFISGGTDSLVYNETLNITRAGLYNVTITKGKEAGYNGKVILDGQGTLNPGIYISTSSVTNPIRKLTISKISVRNYTVNNVLIRHNTRQIYLDSLEISGILSFGININAWQASGTDITKIDSIFINNCKIMSNIQIPSQTDLIYINFAQNIFLLNNRLEQKNITGEGHNDCLQTVYPIGNLTSINNYFINYKVYDSHGAMLNSVIPGSIAKFINNVFFNFGNGACLYDYPINNSSGMIQLFNNSFYVAGQGSGYISYAVRIGSNIAEVYNNIFSSKGYSAVNYADTDPQKINNYLIDYNIYKSYLGSDLYTIAVNNQTMSLTYFKNNYNQDSNSLLAEPYFLVNDEFPLMIDSLSPAINNGRDLSSYFNFDIRNYFRPYNNFWDIGAYEYVENSQSVDNTPPTVVSAALIDSVTLNIIFSEPLEPNGASNPANYFIDNGITVTNANVIGGTNIVRLQTSVHTPGFYNITVNNVTDTAGNIILQQSNSATYGYNPDPITQLFKFIPVQTSASSVPEPDHLPEKTFDGIGYNGGDPSSRWAGNNLPQWIGYDLGDIVMLSKSRVQFYNWENGRIYNYSIQVSVDSINWNNVKSNINSQLAEWTEETFEPIQARYVRILVHSNNQNNWASLWETEFYGQLIISNNDDNHKKLPTEFLLEQNYPNPFNPTTKISWQSPVGSWQTLKVFDILGNEVATLVDEYKEAGRYEVEFDASNLSSGVYIYRLQADAFVSTRKMILLR
ncbi:Peptidase S8/S53 subtilisin kexin sedolisin [Ignavibacterium album JCM 16511]|uniref:Peptidase S8/S53 subtilisin kexin sedolisin n=1 Tax=Ignavibacterium album (strain DSM 19864 / JCM 16511 / NBRC 101810 / Mat9-16) TaxID=945713 RepID=I0AMG5_IGNAJ|nr:discoidin domain-containing protein [Ignavibacterium album]AFH50172.1 Peptidase S8/S53 subtilisin kexin sedolisin [Ignavibacterium album JCM 16511]